MSLQLTYDIERQTNAVGAEAQPKLLNVIEPEYLVDAFLKNPPLGFQSLQVSSHNASTPAFLADFNLLTTLDDEAAAVRDFVDKVPLLKRMLTFPTIFVGTTATEYSNYPDQDCYRSVLSALLHETRKRDAQLLIVKDIPQNSPLLSAEENRKAIQLLRQCEEAEFFVVEGQALAYVPIDFKSIDEFMQRLSKTRRKEFRKKLKDSAHVETEELTCGSKEFFDEAFLETLYGMYMNVYEQSQVHFDILSRSFFKALLQNPDGGGKVFCYKVGGKLIGYNICFLHGKNLVDKYVGFVYPNAREANLYFLSWFFNLDYALKNNLKYYIAGWTDPAVKKSLGARFTLTQHAVFVRNPILRAILKRIKHLFESDSNWIEKNAES